MLFRSIQGFNTFLPPGYRIECHVSTADDEGARNTITVTTPMGVTTRTQDVNGHEAREFVRNQPARPPKPTAVGSASPVPATAPPASAPAADTKPPVHATSTFEIPRYPTTTASQVPKPAPHPRPGMASYWPNLKNPNAPPKAAPPRVPATLPKLPPPASTAAETAPTEPELDAAADAADTIVAAAGATSAASTSDAPTPVMMEFNHAINYVNKIKNRFTKEPETYKTFLEILQTYQKETRPIQEVRLCPASGGSHY